MAIINMPKRTLPEVIEFLIIIEEELPMKWKNMVKYRQNVSNNDESNDSALNIMKRRLKRNLRK
jgi:hypothetical protein